MKLLLTFICILIFQTSFGWSHFNFETRFTDTISYQSQVIAKDSIGNSILVNSHFKFKIKKRRYWKKLDTYAKTNERFSSIFHYQLKTLMLEELKNHPTPNKIDKDIKEIKERVEKKFIQSLKKKKLKLIKINIGDFRVYSSITKIDSAFSLFKRHQIGFELAIPNGWEFNHNGHCQYLSPKSDTKNKLTRSSINISINYVLSGTTPKKYVDYIIANNRNKEHLIAKGDTIINGNKMRFKKSYFETNRNFDNKKLIVIQYFYTLREQYPATIRFSYYEGDNYEEEFNKAINTLVFN